MYGDLNLKQLSLRSKCFQSSYCAKVRAEAKKRLRGRGEEVPSFPSPSPIIHFFCCCPSFLDEPREETLATQATYYYSGVFCQGKLPHYRPCISLNMTVRFSLSVLFSHFRSRHGTPVRGHKTKETYTTRPGSPTPCKQGLKRGI